MNSCRNRFPNVSSLADAFRFCGNSVAAPHFGGEGLRDPIALSVALRNLTNVFMGKLELPRDIGDDTPKPPGLLELRHDGSKIHCGNHPLEIGDYAETRMTVNQKTRIRVDAAARPEIAAAFKAARAALGLTQLDLAKLLGSSQGAITRWERGIDSPPMSALVLLLEMVPEDQREIWQSFVGIESNPVDKTSLRSIPVLRDAAAAGTPRAVDDREIDFHFSLPRRMLPAGGSLVAIPVSGDSMSPVLEDGYIAIIDISARDPKRLVGRMVAAREGDGLTLKWLGQENGMYLLLPQNHSARHPIRVMNQDGDWSIVGEVVKWIGEPPPVSTQKQRE